MSSQVTTSIVVWSCLALCGAGSTDLLADPSIVANRGQADPAVRFYIIGERSDVYFTTAGPVVALRRSTAAEGLPQRRRERRFAAVEQRFAVRIRPAGAASAPRIEGSGPLSMQRTYFPGNGRRIADVDTYREVVYRGVWPGVDIAYGVRRGELTYRILVAPGADPSPIDFTYDGATRVDRLANGYRIVTPLGTLRDSRPRDSSGVGTIAYSAPRGATEPAGGATMREQTESGLRWSTLLGGQADDAIYSVDLDPQMRPVVTGATRSSDFPTSLGALDTAYAGSHDVFVSKLAADGTTLLWSTFLGAADDDRGWVVRLDSASRPLIAGVTASTLFPTTAGAFDTTHNGSYDAFVAKLSADGATLLWSTFFGGGAREWDVSGLVLDDSDRPFLVGSTRSSDLPTTPGALDDTLDGTADAFVTLLAADGGTQVFGTYLGGSGFDAAEGVAVDAAGRAVVAGWTYSDDFPVTAQALQQTRAGTGTAQDAFVSRLAADGSSLVFSTYLGGDASDEAFGIALDGAGRVLITGKTESADFPTTAGSFEPDYTSSGDGFLVSIAADGASLLWGTYLGGTSLDSLLAVATDTWDQPLVAGWTCSNDLPTAGAAYDESFNGTCDGFVARFSEDGASLRYGSYLGWWFDESAYALAVDDAGRPIVGGETTSVDFPTTPGAFDSTHNSPDWYDGFLVSLLMPSFCTHLAGTGPTLSVERAVLASCVAGAPTGELYDVIEGRIDQLGSGTLGPVEPIACGATAVVFATDTEPLPGQPLYQLARVSAGGSYADGGGVGQVGARVPLSGDCP